MADIDVVPKRGTKTWVWIVLALVIIAVLWMMLGRGPSRSGRLEDGAFAPLMAEAVVPFTSTV